jgi:beta-glucosidase
MMSDAADPWRQLTLPSRRDERVEAEIEATLSQMSLDEKLGQMIQAEVQQLRPEDIERYKIGSALNGAGVWPKKNRFSTPHDWAAMVEAFWTASKRSFADRPFSIPFAWATDAVHGHNNLFGATIFPHNIGLGATRDPELIHRIGRVTAREIAAGGMDWTFAPTVTVSMDARWGRFYEGYSQDTEIVRAFAAQMVRGLEGVDAGSDPDTRILSSIKHWLGDGGTRWGIDRGTTFASERELRDVHAVPYIAALKAGAQVVMLSFSSWEHERNYDFCPDQGAPYNYKLHGSRYLITDVLKNQLGFDGVVLTDWDGQCEVSKCTLKDARYCINAGADVLMVEARGDWLAILEQTRRDLERGLITQDRIDDAVRRVLRVKKRSALAGRIEPTRRALVQKAASVVGCKEHRAVAREAVRKSLVLLKNDRGLLPLDPSRRVLVAGSAARNLSKHTGGWSLSWQSTDIGPEDIPHATTIAAALEAALPAGNCIVLEDDGAPLPEGVQVAVIAIGEDAYAEMMGDIRPWRSLEYAALKPSYRKDRTLLERLRDVGIPTVCVFFGGRPLYLTEEINLSDSFVVAWLPGIAGEGIADVLLRDGAGRVQHDFHGRLPYPWPKTPYSFRLAKSSGDVPDGGHPEYQGDTEALFPLGFGLDYVSPRTDVAAPRYPVYVHREPPSPPKATSTLVLLGPGADPDLTLRIAGNGFWVGADVSRSEPTDALLGRLEPIDHLGAKDAFHVYFNGRIASLYLKFPGWDTRDLRGYLDAGADLVFDLRMHAAMNGPVRMSAHDCYPSQGVLRAERWFQRAPIGEWTSVRVPLTDIANAGSDFGKVNVPFMLHTDAEMKFDIGNVRWELRP